MTAEKIHIDGSVYPDLRTPPEELRTLEDKADYVHRICSALDSYLHPEPETFRLFSGWREVFDSFPLPFSPGYRAFRTYFGWPSLDSTHASFASPPLLYEELDAREGRGQDPCEDLL